MTISDERLQKWHDARGRQDRTITINGAKGLAEFDALVAIARVRRCEAAECEAWRDQYESPSMEGDARLKMARAATDAARREMEGS